MQKVKKGEISKDFLIRTEAEAYRRKGKLSFNAQRVTSVFKINLRETEIN